MLAVLVNKTYYLKALFEINERVEVLSKIEFSLPNESPGLFLIENFKVLCYLQFLKNKTYLNHTKSLLILN